jgi:GGDEF domain-containing protein
MTTAVELMVWSANAGAVGLLVLVAAADLALSRGRAAAQTLAYLASIWLFVVLMSGLPKAALPALDAGLLHAAQVLVGPLCGALATYWVRHWLAARRRDRLMETSLRVAAVTCVAAGPACLMLPPGLQLPVSAAVACLDTGAVLWLAVRAALLGDRLSWGMAAGCGLMLPAAIGLYALPLGGTPPAVAWQMLASLCGIASLSVIGSVLWLRNRETRRAHRSDPAQSRFDPVTRLYSGLTLVQKIIKAQRRRRRNRRHGAVLAVMVFNTEALARQIGQAGLNELFIHLATRIQREVGVVNPVGRYYDRCFVALVETLHSPSDIRTLGLRVAARARRPMEIRSLDGDALSIKADIGVGVVHLASGRTDVDDILHEAQDVAQAARRMRSRAAMLEPGGGQPVPVEQAQLGTRWKSLRAAAPPGSRPVYHAARG